MVELIIIVVSVIGIIAVLGMIFSFAELQVDDFREMSMYPMHPEPEWTELSTEYKNTKSRFTKIPKGQYGGKS